MKKQILISIIVGLLFAGALTFGASVGGKFNVPNYFKKSGSAINPYISTDELGSTSDRIAKIWTADFDTTNMTIGGVSSGNIDMNNNLILNIGASGTDFTSGGGLNVTATTTLSGNLLLKDNKYLYFNTAETIGMKYGSDHGSLIVPSELVATGRMTFYSNTGADASGNWEPFIDLQGGSITFSNISQGGAGEKYANFYFLDGIKLRTIVTGGRSAIILADNLATSDKTFQFPNLSGDLLVASTTQDISTTGSLSVSATTTLNTAWTGILRTDSGVVSTTTVSSTYIRSSSKVVCASDSIDTTNCDYLCDGTNDQTDMASAITAIASKGGTVKLMEGTYNMGAALVITTANIDLVGSGKGTIVKRMYNSTLAGIVEANQANITIRDIYFDGNNGTYAGTTNVLVEFTGAYKDRELLNSHLINSAIGVFSTGGQYVLVNGCSMENITHFSFDLPGADYWTISDNFLYPPDTSNVVFYVTGTNINIQNNLVKAINVNKLVNLDSSSVNILISGNIFSRSDTPAGGYAVGYDNAGARNISIIDNMISGTFSRGVSVAGSSHIIRGNQFYQIERDAIIPFAAITDSIIEGNIIVDCGKNANNSWTGISLPANSVRNVIKDNVIYSGQGNQLNYGIREAATSTDYNIISGNQVRNTATQDISQQGFHTQVYGNCTEDHHFEQKLTIMKNVSGGSLVAGDIVIIKAVAAGNEVTTTTSQGADGVFGMVSETIANAAFGLIKVLGKTTLLKVDGTADIAIGDFIGTFTTAKIGMKAAAGDMAIAIALEAYTTDDSAGVIDALLITPRAIQ